MSDYCEIAIAAEDAMHDILIAELAEIGYDGFEEFPGLLKAFVPEPDFIENELNILLNKYDIRYFKSIIKKQNWNAVWESNFEPVQVDDFVGVRASFHPSVSQVEHEIIITPKMSFGTGHHATTYMVMKLMQELDFHGKSVFDFGTGTGILAILAEKLGATQLLAVDNDDWCIENASENIAINKCNNIDLQKIESLKLSRQFEIIIANINRNIILDNIGELRRALPVGSQLLLSGLLKEDEADIIDVCHALGLQHKKTLERSGWIALWFFLLIPG
ncbi:MAG: 50S ribosomal protein L11 methyltransferase [Sediminibacterium sp.]